MIIIFLLKFRFVMFSLYFFKHWYSFSLGTYWAKCHLYQLKRLTHVNRHFDLDKIYRKWPLTFILYIRKYCKCNRCMLTFLPLQAERYFGEWYTCQGLNPWLCKPIQLMDHMMNIMCTTCLRLFFSSVDKLSNWLMYLIIIFLIEAVVSLSTSLRPLPLCQSSILTLIK